MCLHTAPREFFWNTKKLSINSCYILNCYLLLGYKWIHKQTAHIVLAINMFSHSNWKYKGPYYSFLLCLSFFFYKWNNFFKTIKMHANKYICRDAHRQIQNCSNYSLLHKHMHTWMQNLFMYFYFFYVFLLYRYIDFKIYQENVALFTMDRVQIGLKRLETQIILLWTIFLHKINQVMLSH